MAQTGFTPIQLYFSSTTTNVPLAADLANGELAINITDGKLFYKDNSSAVQVIGWKIVPATAGGTGQTSYAVGDLLYANTTTTLAKLADVATGNALISGGVGVAPSWGKIGLTTHVSGVLPVANGGTNASTASITSFNNITGYSASGATGTTSTNLVFSTSPSITTPTLVGDATLSTGNLVVGTSGKGVTNSSGTVALNFTTTETTIQGLRFGLGPGAVSGNTVFGNAAFNSNTTAGANTVIGFQTLFTSNRTADANGENTAVGHQAGYETSTGQKNTYFGRYAGNQLATGSNNVYIGAYSTASGSNVTNEIILGYNITGKGSNTAYIGGSSGAYNQANSATWSVVSDSRIKENVVTLTGALESILKLRPVSFNYIINKNPDVSFIAQEYELVFPEQVVQHTASKEEKELTNSDTLYGVRQNLVPYLVSAIQELKAEIELLKSQIGSN